MRQNITLALYRGSRRLLWLTDAVILALSILLLTIALPVTALADTARLPNCPPSGNSRAARVEYVIDGDTLILDDDTRVRVIGINSPELNRHNGSPEPFAVVARSAVIKAVRQNLGQVTLYPEAESTDQHGRALFHVQLATGENLAAVLLQAGLAVQSAVAPNTACAIHYAQLEKVSRAEPVGIWTQPDFWLVDSIRLKKSVTGFRIIRDRVTNIRNAKNNTRLTLAHGVVVTLTDDTANKINPSVATLIGRMIEVRGWLSRHRGKHFLRLHHSANLVLL